MHKRLLDGERLVAIFGEHGDDHVQYDFGFGQICGRAFDEDIPRIERDFRVIPVDDRRHGKNHAIGVVDHWIYWRIADDGEELPQVKIGGIQLHQLSLED